MAVASLGLNNNMLSIHRSPTIDEKIKSAREYEEMFLKFLFNNIMPKNDDGYLSNSSNSEVYRSFWVDAAAKQAAKQGIGIAKQILCQMERAEKAAEMALTQLAMGRNA